MAIDSDLTLPRAAAALRANRWLPGADDLAACFSISALDGVFSKVLSVPVGMRAYILQGEQALELGQGEHVLEDLFTRLNHLLRDQRTDILVTRMAALPVEFEFNDVATCEGLVVHARVRVNLKIEPLSIFARQVMDTEGVIGQEQLRSWIGLAVRQLAAEFVGSRSLREMAKNTDLRAEFDERLQSGLKQRIAQFGLAISGVDTLSLRHAREDAQQDQAGQLWLVTEKAAARVEAARQLDQIYNQDEWRRIAREEQQQLAKLRRGEIAIEQGERAHALRLRQVELYARIAEAKTRHEAQQRGAAEALAELEHEVAKSGATRLRDEDAWSHLRTLAQVRMRADLEVAKQEGLDAIVQVQQRCANQLLRQQVAFRLEQARVIEDEARRRTLTIQAHEQELAAARHLAAIEAEEQRAALALRRFEHAARESEAARLLEWEAARDDTRLQEVQQAQALQALRAQEQQEQVGQRIADQQRSGREREAESQAAKLARTLELEAAANTNLRVLERARWQDGQDRLLSEQAHQAALARIEIERVEALGRIDAERLRAMAPILTPPQEA